MSNKANAASMLLDTHYFPYQQQGMLHLAFTERALLADEMGLGQNRASHCRL